MKLRRVDIFGFKSFRDRTALDISEGVTAVVGPNGCGKSNIVDAIRWALGSQSPRELRGRAMEDVIFGGSESHRPSGYAEVSIVLSNEERSATGPWRDVAEIRVTRRLYRTGDSEYEINRSRARLRDIQELFLGTGVSIQDGYSIIEQGRVGFIVSSRPEERRTLIEEAAGVTRYRYQRKHTERRLQQTRDNLLRVRDIMDEVERRVQALERQAERARRWKQLRDDRRDHQIRLALLHHDASSAALAEAGAASEAAERVEVDARTSLSREVAAAEQVRVEAFAAEKELSDHAELAYRLRARFDVLENDASHQRREEATLQARLAALDEEMTRLHEEESSRRIAIHRLGEEVAGERTRAEACALGLAEAEAELETRALAEAQTRKALEALQEEERVAARRRAGLEGTIEADEAELVRLQERSQGTEAERTPLDEALRRAEEAQAKAEAEAEAAQRGLTEAVALLEGARATEKSAREGLQAHEAERRKEDARLRGIVARREALEQTIARGEGLERAVGRTLAAAREGRLSGVVGTLAQRLRPLPDREAALEALLGAWVQAVVVEGEESARAVIAWAREEGIALRVLALAEDVVAGEIAGWATLVAPVPAIVATWLSRGREVPDALAEGGSEEVWDGGLTWRHAPGAWEIRSRSDGGGEVLFRAGRALDEVQAEEAAQRPRCEAMAEEGSRREAALEEAVRVREAAEVAGEAARRGATERGMAAREAVQESGRLRRALERARSDAEAMAARQKEIAHRLEERRGRLAEEEEARAGREAALAAAADAQAAAREALDAARERSAEARVAEVRAGERLRAGSAELAVAERERARARERLDAAQAEVGQARERLGALERAREENEGTMEAARKELQAAEEQRRLLEERHARAQTGLREREAERLRMQRALDAARDAAQVAALALEKARAEAAYAVRALQERFGLGLNEARQGWSLPEDGEAEQRALEKVERAIERLGPVNPAAQEEYEEAKQRLETLEEQKADLETAMADLEKAIRKMDRTSRELFRETFEAVNLGFQALFPRLFRGGRARLELSDPDNLLESGVEIVAQPPGKRLQSITLLSGGEKALTAVALIFAIFQLKPAPFSILDEVDAPLDEGNVGRFADLVAELADRSQFLLITHNRRTMEAANTLYGITMEEPGVSKVVGVRLEGEARAGELGLDAMESQE